MAAKVGMGACPLGLGDAGAATKNADATCQLRASVGRSPKAVLSQSEACSSVSSSQDQNQNDPAKWETEVSPDQESQGGAALAPGRKPAARRPQSVRDLKLS